MLRFQSLLKTSTLAIFFLIFLSLSGLSYADIPIGGIQASAAVLVDSSCSILYAKNAEAKLPPASTTKLVTAMVVLDNISPKTLVTVSRNAARTESVQPRLIQNEQISVEGLLHLALMGSINSSAVSLAEAVAGTEQKFAEMMNAKAFSLGAYNSYFANASGLPSSGIQYTTAYDLTLILKEALQYPLIREILGKKQAVVSTTERALIVSNTDRLLWADENMIGGKTGYTNKAQHCFVGAIETENGIIYSAILGAKSRSYLWQSTSDLMGIENSLALKHLTASKLTAHKPAPRKSIKAKQIKHSTKRAYTAKNKRAKSTNAKKKSSKKSR